MNLRDHSRPLADGRRHSLRRTGPNIANGEYAWQARLQRQMRRTGCVALSSRAGEDVAFLIQRHASVEPRRIRLRADEHEDVPDR